MQTIVATSTHTQVSASGTKKRSAPLDPMVADKLLDLLSTDNAFRRLFKRDPRKALEQVGFVQSAIQVTPAGCFLGITKLASKAEIIRSRDALKTMLTSGLAYLPVQLDAASGGAQRLKRK